jgi:hypothetical protein
MPATSDTMARFHQQRLRKRNQGNMRRSSIGSRLS